MVSVNSTDSGRHLQDTIENIGAFIHPFTVRGAWYVYDVNSNEIVQVSQEIADALKLSSLGHISQTDSANSADDITEDAISSIKKARVDGLFSVQRPCSIKDGYAGRTVVEKILADGVRSMTLVVSEDCNLRCKYCHSVLEPDQRSGDNRYMSTETAKQAVDFLLSHSGRIEKSVNIAFYGGEPLLNQDVVRSTMEYAQSASGLRGMTFSMTTNAILLSKEFVDFLILRDSQIRILVSLDGPKEIHDANRVLASGDGSFDQVHKNLQHLYEYAPDWFRSHISFCCTIGPPYELSAREAFFKDCGLQCRSSPRKSHVADEDIRQYFSDVEAAREERRNNLRPVKMRLRSSLQGNRFRRDVKDNQFWLLSDALETLKAIHHRPVFPMGMDPVRSMGCVMGADKLVVSPLGDFYPCEKVDWIPEMRVGSLQKGFDIDRILELRQFLADYAQQECRRCWGLRLCDTCLMADCRGRLNPAKMRDACDEFLQYLEATLAFYCEIAADNPAAFEQLEGS